MRFEATKNLSAALSVVAGVAQPRQLPVLQNVLLRLIGNRLSLTATDLEIEITASTDVAGSKDGEITIPARKLADIAKLHPDRTPLSVQIDGDKAKLCSESSRFTLGTLPAEHFPAFSSMEYGEPCDIDADVLRTLINRVSFSMAKQDVRHYLNGLYLESAEGMLRAVASDGHRLSLCEAPTDSPPFAVILPAKAVAELEKLLRGADVVRWSVAPNAIRAEAGGVTLQAKLIEAKFPDWRRVMPRDMARSAVVEREALLGALKRVALLSSDKYRSILLRMNEAGISIKATNADAEEAEDSIAAVVTGKPLRTGFNADYLMDALSHASGASVTLAFPKAVNAGLITDNEDASFRFVVMPMRV